MGIDIYARWRGQTTQEELAQYRVIPSIEHGCVGYLSEGHGAPYATQYLCREAFESEDTMTGKRISGDELAMIKRGFDDVRGEVERLRGDMIAGFALLNEGNRLLEGAVRIIKRKSRVK